MSRGTVEEWVKFFEQYRSSIRSPLVFDAILRIVSHGSTQSSQWLRLARDPVVTHKHQRVIKTYDSALRRGTRVSRSVLRQLIGDLQHACPTLEIRDPAIHPVLRVIWNLEILRKCQKCSPYKTRLVSLLPSHVFGKSDPYLTEAACQDLFNLYHKILVHQGCAPLSLDHLAGLRKYSALNALVTLRYLSMSLKKLRSDKDLDRDIVDALVEYTSYVLIKMLQRNKISGFSGVSERHLTLLLEIALLLKETEDSHDIPVDAIQQDFFRALRVDKIYGEFVGTPPAPPYRLRSNIIALGLHQGNVKECLQIVQDREEQLLLHSDDCRSREASLFNDIRLNILTGSEIFYPSKSDVIAVLEPMVERLPCDNPEIFKRVKKVRVIGPLARLDLVTEPDNSAVVVLNRIPKRAGKYHVAFSEAALLETLRSPLARRIGSAEFLFVRDQGIYPDHRRTVSLVKTRDPRLARLYLANHLLLHLVLSGVTHVALSGVDFYTSGPAPRAEQIGYHKTAARRSHHAQIGLSSHDIVDNFVISKILIDSGLVTIPDPQVRARMATLETYLEDVVRHFD